MATQMGPKKNLLKKIPPKSTINHQGTTNWKKGKPKLPKGNG